jgi:hypothetical protein
MDFGRPSSTINMLVWLSRRLQWLMTLEVHSGIQGPVNFCRRRSNRHTKTATATKTTGTAKDQLILFCNLGENKAANLNMI